MPSCPQKLLIRYKIPFVTPNIEPYKARMDRSQLSNLLKLGGSFPIEKHRHRWTTWTNSPCAAGCKCCLSKQKRVPHSGTTGSFIPSSKCWNLASFRWYFLSLTCNLECPPKLLGHWFSWFLVVEWAVTTYRESNKKVPPPQKKKRYIFRMSSYRWYEGPSNVSGNTPRSFETTMSHQTSHALLENLHSPGNVSNAFEAF